MNSGMLWNAAELALAAELAAQARAGPGTRRSRPVRLRHARRPHDMDVRVRGKGVRAAAVRSVSGACRSRSSAVGGPPLYVSSSSSSTVNGEVHAKDSKRLTRTKPPESLRNKPKQTMYGFGGSPVWTFMAAATGRRAGVVVAVRVPALIRVLVFAPCRVPGLVWAPINQRRNRGLGVAGTCGQPECGDREGARQ
jgi:hypothetical protein